jgi:hypothetical protein
VSDPVPVKVGRPAADDRRVFRSPIAMLDEPGVRSGDRRRNRRTGCMRRRGNERSGTCSGYAATRWPQTRKAAIAPRTFTGATLSVPITWVTDYYGGARIFSAMPP